MAAVQCLGREGQPPPAATVSTANGGEQLCHEHVCRRPVPDLGGGPQTAGGDGLVHGHPAPRRVESGRVVGGCVVDRVNVVHQEHRDAGGERRWRRRRRSTARTATLTAGAAEAAVYSSERDADRGGGVARRELVACDEPTSVTTVGWSVVAAETWRFPRLPVPSLSAERHRPASVETGSLYTQHHPMRRAPARPARAVLRIAALTIPAAESLSLRCRLRFGLCSHRFHVCDATVDGYIEGGFRQPDA